MAAVNHSFWKIYVWPQLTSDIRCSEFINFYPKFEILNLDFLKMPLKVKPFQSMWVLSSFQVTLTFDLDITFFACRKVNKIIASCVASLRLVVFLSLFYFNFFLIFREKKIKLRKSSISMRRLYFQVVIDDLAIFDEYTNLW